MLTLHLRINDAATGKPTPVRMRVSGSDGTPYAPLARSVAFPTRRNEAVGGPVKLGAELWFAIDGACEIALPAGVPLRVQATKGPEFTPLDETITLGAGQIAMRFAISRWADARKDGWLRIDSRCHFLTPHDALLEAEAEDLDVVNLLATVQPFPSLDGTAYPTVPNLTAFSGQHAALERHERAVAVNTLNTHPVLGKVALLHSHRPVFPLTYGGEETDDWGIGDWCDQCHRKGGLVVWVDPFEAAGGVVGGEALVAAILGKIDAIEHSATPRKLPLLPWLYRLWNAGVMVPLVGGSGKDCNKVALGAMRTYVRSPGIAGWVTAVKAGHTFVSAGPLLAFQLNDKRLRASGRARGSHGKLEIVANGDVIAAAEAARDAETHILHAECEAELPVTAWAAVRWTGSDGFAHSSPITLRPSPRKPEAVAALHKLIEQTRNWIEQHGRYANPKRREQVLARCEEARTKLELPR